jgi:hypothetical protein
VRAVCGLLKGRGREEVARERVVVGASTAGDVGERLGTRRGLTGGVRKAERERERSLVRKETAPIGLSHRAARERERKSARVGADRRDPPVRHQGHAGALAQSWA